jgi:hypothetical protein
VVGVKVARERGLVGILDVDADHPATHDQVVGPAHRAAGAREALRQHAGAGEVEGDARQAGLGVALVLGVVVEGDRGGATRDGGGLVEGRVGDAQAVARGHVALRVVAEGGLDHPPEMEVTPYGSKCCR